jgi:phosphoglycolate phosphatase-like HAD superfamily hydrolase
MKKLYSILFIISTFYSTAIITKTPTKKPVIITDFDDVWIKKSSLLGILPDLKHRNNKSRSKKPSKKKNDKLGNLPLKLLDYGRRHPRLSSYTPGLIKYIGKSRRINKPIHNLYKHLKAENYSIVIATNKDHMLYDLSVQKLGNEIPSMVDKVFVAEPQSDATAIAQLQAFANKPKTSTRYKNMVHKAINIKETDKVVHVPHKKPDQEYYKYVIERIGQDNDMIFIDDKQDNVDAFNALQKNTQYLRLGIRYDKHNLKQFTKDLKKAGLI